ncbi:MAG TPA: serine protease [Edaphocola sp.]|nr:serine protease [Edaphocola sp.]
MMISEQNISLWAERYLNNELNPSEKEVLNNALTGSSVLRASWQEAISVLNLLKQKGQLDMMRQKIQASAFKNNNRIGQAHIAAEAQNSSSRLLPFISGKKRYLKMTAIAAGLVVFTSLGTLWLAKSKSATPGNQYMLLRREIENIKSSQSKMMDSLNKLNIQEPIYGGTGFALTNSGYIATNYHVVKDAHDIYVQTAGNNTYKAYVIAFEPATDVAVLKIEDSAFRFGRTPLPYGFAETSSGLGQKVFTMGYPQEDLVYNEGYISCEKGFDNDSSSYQLEMVANPGQSGAPVLDQRGNVIALVTGKQSNTSGTTYAVHTNALLQLINSLPENTQKEIRLPNGSGALRGLSRIAQVKNIRPYICAVKVN